ncbi:sigma-70 family RNA polymerase sigma factor [Caulobacter segnis]|jgi:RNA polymerase sigma-70 factor (ECF subfamily)|uniref:sigma-70 family RNA polymerase sigma factor n=1 Tax=Caulobacter segnis TaxID=88688 RepID=UPI001CBF1B2D|nr:sigma-70 family RNA polymerase sigma factor [Caulobacter segnis]UAL11463.1 sigma-70 family RNA polymerase sigma factor [Caulobacter segnis]
MSEKNYLAEKFEADRARLRGVAYRMLGSLPEAEDAVQEAWLRLSRADASGVDNLSAWLTTVTSRVCLDMLRSRKSRREDALDGGPEPSVSGEDAIERETILADSVGLALLVVLQALSPAERIAFVLHDLFDMPFEQIAPIVERTPDAARQLASRARRRVRGGAAPLDDAQTAQKSVVDAFLTASRTGDLAGLMAVLDPNVVVRADVFAGGGQTRELRGAERVANFYNGLAQTARTALVDGAIGAVVAPLGKLYVVLDIKVENGKVVEIFAAGDPERLAAAEVSVV